MPVLLQVHRLSSDFGGNPCESVMKSVDTNKEKKTRLGAFHIFWDLTFFLIVLNQSLFTFEVTIFWTILIDYVRDKAIDRSKEVYFLVCISLSDMVARLGLGLVVDSGFMQLANYCALCYFVMGIALCFTVWSNNFVLMILSVFLFSLMTGGAMIVLPGQVISFMKKEDLAMAMPSRMILFAPLSLTASPLIGGTILIELSRFGLLQDDVVLMARSKYALIEFFNGLIREASTFGLDIIVEKTKYMNLDWRN
ncbi:uncharacterized protein CEXT_84731 [Caerostris extrusa]|uniref:Uncharacterized protein n=1 Tax=Caerostris extrusa TaxID=172846 RepID=A0AAV4RHJ7_CAEEX|nr:uncharacterized protein CEXT_84731 [Caerostris extrusa]